MSSDARSNTNTSSTRQKVVPPDDSMTRTLSPIYPPEKGVPGVSGLPEVKIDGDMLELGVIFDEYELIRYLGGGGMGNVWLALDANLNRLVALKVLHADKSENTEVVKRFYSEAQVSALLNHPNIAQIYTFRNHETKRKYITMEYIAGDNLRDLVKNNGPLKVEDTILVALQIAHALAHLEFKRVVHRDIKPSNILLTPSGEAKLIDLGLARIVSVFTDDWDSVNRSLCSDITASGVTLGTFDYISPEQARDPRTVDSRSDIYSLGCTLYFLLTGQPPFPQGNPLQKLLQHQSDNPMDIRLSRTDVPDSLTAVLNKAMKKNPEERYAHPNELIEDLEMIAQEMGIQVQHADLPSAQNAQAPGYNPQPWVFPWRVLVRQLFWVVPTLVLFVAIWTLSSAWTPTESELQLPPAAGLERTAPSYAESSQTPVPISVPVPISGPVPTSASVPASNPASNPASVPVMVPASVPTTVPSSVPASSPAPAAASVPVPVLAPNPSSAPSATPAPTPIAAPTQAPTPISTPFSPEINPAAGTVPNAPLISAPVSDPESAEIPQ